LPPCFLLDDVLNLGVKLSKRLVEVLVLNHAEAKIAL
jgi:hypothetical protein